MKNLKSKVAVVTGAGSGIGRELALNLAAQGCRLALADINKAGLAETVALLGLPDDQVSSHQVDVSDRVAFYQFEVGWKKWTPSVMKSIHKKCSS